ncbi:hypothetical protein LTR08_003259 [Meristemomyces frigidus]|nr:hypothetical protein LTR08_003259 [Meristemomyces frigidus]
MTSSPLRLGASLQQELDYYKTQYDQLETDLADFQASSKELEEQLERDIDTAETSERKLKAQGEKLRFEVEEWKAKHKQAKAEANGAQNALQKEITGLRESCRGLGLKVRDIEVVNDDYERAARNTESSLEDLESKYNVAIERGVLSEEEIKTGELEREQLRIETQRLRDELGDLKVEAEITREKLRLADATVERLRSRKPSPLAVQSLRARSEGSDGSAVTPASPTASTPTPQSTSASMVSDMATPPSPPLSDVPAHANATEFHPPLLRPLSLLPPDPAATATATTPRPSLYGPRTAPQHSRGPSLASSTGALSVSTDAAAATRAMKPPATKPRQHLSSRPSVGQPDEPPQQQSLPRSDSLFQIKALRGRMQKIEARVHSARSKLPPPGTSGSGRTPTNSPRVGGPVGASEVPASVTMRRSLRRGGGSTASSLLSVDGGGAGRELSPARRESRLQRLSSHGGLRAGAKAGRARSRSPERGLVERPDSRAMLRTPSRAMDRPCSRALERPPSSSAGTSRPPSSAGVSRPGSRASFAPPVAASTSTAPRPSSRAGAPTSARRESVDLRASSRTGGEALPHRPGSRAGAVAGGGQQRQQQQTPLATRTRTASAAVGAGTLDFRASVGALGTRAAAQAQMQTPRTPASGLPPAAAGSRPRSSHGGGAGGAGFAAVGRTGTVARKHRPSVSFSELRGRAMESEDSGGGRGGFTPGGRRTAVEKEGGRGGMPVSLAGGVGKREGGGVGGGGRTLRRTSLGFGGLGEGEMRPPPRPGIMEDVEDVGETY